MRPFWGIAGLICKIIGAVYRIPLTNIIGEEAMGDIFKGISDIYPFTCFIHIRPANGNFKTGAERYAMNDPRGAESIFKLGKKHPAYLGGICMSLMMLFSGLIANSLGISEGHLYYLLAPSLILSVMSSLLRVFPGHAAYAAIGNGRRLWAGG